MKKGFNIKISQKILGGFSILVLIFIANAILGIVTLERSEATRKESSEIVSPSLAFLNQFNLLNNNSRMFITNWVYLRANTEDKEALKRLHETDYPELKTQINLVKPYWSQEQQARMDSAFAEFEALLEVEKAIMGEMVTFEDYEDEQVKFINQTRIDDDILPKARQIEKQLEILIANQKKENKKADDALLHSFSNMRKVSLSAGILIVIVGLVAAFLLTRSIITPINYIRNIIQQLGQGELPSEQKMKFGNDEIGEMAAAVAKLVAGLRSTSLFAENIGNGNYQAQYSPLSDKDVLGNALINMRNNLAKVAEDDKKRNWATEGVAKFSEILRKNTDNLSNLSDEIISNLVKYTHSNQGGLFIVNDENAKEKYLELRACYAWDKKKYLEQRIYLGEGLAGQTWQEGDTTYITEVPNDYIQITSGLGEANPRSILIVPLKVNDQIYGVVEMASFQEYQPHEIEFVEKIGESIASTISSAKIAERTQKLLEDSTMLAEQMRAQEEEMRQNMEELQATQEEMQRAQHDAKARELIFENTQLLAEFDSSFKITYTNHILQSQLKFTAKELIGSRLDMILETSEQMEQVKRTLKENKIWSSIVNVRNKSGEKLQVKASVGVVSNSYQGSEKYLLILDGLEMQN